MRESLTIFAVAVILVLSALLVGPYLINWNNQRDFLAAKLSEAAGVTVKIAGPVDVKLLPRPIFTAGLVTVSGKSPQEPKLSAERLDAELSLNALLQGAVEFVDATVVAPRLDLVQQPDGSIVAPAWDIASPHKFQFNHVLVDGGTVVIHDTVGAERFTLKGLNAQGEADTLIGPAKLNGRAETGQGPVNFRLTFGGLASHRLRTKLTVDRQGAITRIDADGMLIFPSGPATATSSVQFQGLVNLLGGVHVADGASPVPWHLQAAGVVADARGIQAPALELRAGVDERALVANGQGVVAFGKTATAQLQLKSRQLDLDSITVPPDVAPDTPKPSAAQWLAAVNRLATDNRIGSLPVALSADLAIDAVTQGGLVLTNASARFDAVPHSPLRGRFEVSGPDATRLALAGTVETGAAAAFQGQAEATTHNLPGMVALLRPLLPDTVNQFGDRPPVTAVDFKGGLTLSKVGFTARDMTMTLDGSTVAGTLSLTAGVAAERPRLFADVTAETLDADRLPDLAPMVCAGAPLDLSIALKAKAAKLTSATLQPIEAGQLALHITKTADTLALDEFSIAALGGATVTGSASLDAKRVLTAQGHVKAPAVAPLAQILHQLFPNGSTEALVNHAAALSPMDADLKLEGDVDTDWDMQPRLASVRGLAGAVQLSAQISPEAAQKFGSSRLSGTLTADAADASLVLRQWGLPYAGVPLGAGHLEGSAHGTVQLGFDTQATLSLAQSKASFSGRIETDSASGHVKLGGSDASTAAAALGVSGLAVPASAWDADGDAEWQSGQLRVSGLTAHVAGSAISGDLAYGPAPATAGGAPLPMLTGALKIDAVSLPALFGLALGAPGPLKPGQHWSTAAFAPMPILPRSDVKIQAGALAIPSQNWTAKDVSMSLRTGNSALTLADLKASLFSGTVGGSLTLRRDGAGASVAGRLAFDNTPVSLPSFAAKASLALDLAGTGTNPDALVGSLGGQGNLALAGVTVPRFYPAALSRVAATYDADGVTVDDAGAREAVGKALDLGPLTLGDMTAPVTLAAGTLRVIGLQAKAPAYAVTSEGAYDLRAGTLTTKTTLTLVDLPKDWKGDAPQVTVTQSGPPAAPVRAIDSAAFTNGLAARAIARDQERIDLMKDDLRERAFFARRLRQIEAEQQAKRDAARIETMDPQATKAPPRGGPAAPTQPGSGQTPDGISRLLDQLGTPAGQKPPKAASQAPIVIPPLPAVPPPVMSPAGQDPGAAGLY